MRREILLSLFREAGYHDDKAKFTRLLIENRIKREVAEDQWSTGIKQKISGMKCGCYLCNKVLNT